MPEDVLADEIDRYLDIEQLMEQDAASFVPTDESLTQVRDLVSRVETLDGKIVEAEESLKRLKEARERILRVDLPERMTQYRITDLGLEGGRRLEVEQVVRASISEERREACYAYMRKNGAGPLIKTTVKSTYGKGQDEQAQALARQLQDAGVSVSMSETVAWQHLVGWVRDTPDVPDELFGVYRGSEAKIVKPKQATTNKKKK